MKKIYNAPKAEIEKFLLHIETSLSDLDGLNNNPNEYDDDGDD